MDIYTWDFRLLVIVDSIYLSKNNRENMQRNRELKMHSEASFKPGSKQNQELGRFSWSPHISSKH